MKTETYYPEIEVGATLGFIDSEIEKTEMLQKMVKDAEWNLNYHIGKTKTYRLLLDALTSL
jgi:hypothetical protein